LAFGKLAFGKLTFWKLTFGKSAFWKSALKRGNFRGAVKKKFVIVFLHFHIYKSSWSDISLPLPAAAAQSFVILGGAEICPIILSENFMLLV
jgi:hypothetical protein